MRKLFGFLGAALLALLPGVAAAQGGAACSIAASVPEVVTATTYALTVADACRLKVFTAGSAVTLTAPNPAVTFPSGYSVTIKAQGVGSVTFTPTTGTLDGLSTAIIWTTGTGGEIRTDGTNWYSCCLGIKKP